MDRGRGLYRKFRVYRADGRDQPGHKHHHCALFVLDLNHDPHAQPAIRAYIESCAKEYPALAEDLRAWLDDGEKAGTSRSPTW